MSKTNEIQKVIDNISENIKKIRKSKKFTQEDLAIASGLALRHIQKIESSEVNITLKTLVKISNSLEIDIKTLLNNQREM